MIAGTVWNKHFLCPIQGGYEDCVIMHCLKECEGKMTAGPDNFTSFLWRDCAIDFSKLLTGLLRLSLSKLWGTKRTLKIIVILRNISKVFEKALYDIIYTHVKCRINDSQQSFIRSRSTVTNLACFTQNVSIALNLSSQVDVIYTDFSKGVNRLDLGVILQKLSSFGLTMDFITFFESYLADLLNSPRHLVSTGFHFGFSVLHVIHEWFAFLFFSFFNMLMIVSCFAILFPFRITGICRVTYID